MSANIVPLELVKTSDPLLDLNNTRKYAVLKGGSDVTYKTFVSTSYSDASLNFSCPPPSPAICVSRKVQLECTVRFVFSGSGAGLGNILQTGYDGPRAYPLSSVMNVLNMTLNNTSVSVNMADVLSGVMRYNNCLDNKRRNLSLTPTYQDQSQSYADLVGSNRNPLAAYFDSLDDGAEPRGGFRCNVVSNTPTAAVVDYIFTEPIMVSPFYFGKEEKSAFIGLQNMDLNITWLNNLSRMWSRATNHPQNLTSLTASFVAPPKLFFKYLTPPANMLIPNEISYPYSVVDRFMTEVGSIASTAVQTVSSNNIQFQGVPDHIYVYARRRNSDLNFNSTDTFLSIRRVSVNFNNRSGLLASCSQQDLYQVSKKNGCNMSWSQWSGKAVTNAFGVLGTVGSVLKLRPGLDLPLSPLQAPSSLETLQFQIDCELENVNQSEAINVVLVVVPVYSGTFSIVNQRSITQTNILTKSDVLDADNKAQLNYNEFLHQAEGSGDFMADLSDVLSNPWDKLIKPGISALAPLVPKLLGMGEMEQMKEEMKAGRKGGAKSGGELIGGKLMSKAELKRKLNM
jgi:hypothetical protein